MYLYPSAIRAQRRNKIPTFKAPIRQCRAAKLFLLLYIKYITNLINVPYLYVALHLEFRVIYFGLSLGFGHENNRQCKTFVVFEGGEVIFQPSILKVSGEKYSP